MRQTDDPEFLDHLRAENAHTEQWFAPHEATVSTVFAEITSRIQETDLSAPTPHAEWWYVTRTVEGRNYPIHHRGPTADSATEHVLLDENLEAENTDFFHLGAFTLDVRQRLIAWSCDTAGDEHYLLRVRDASTGIDLDDELHDTANAGVAWAADSTSLFYVTADEQERPFKVWRHVLGTDQSDDLVVFTEPDERFYVTIGATRSERFVVIQCSSRVTADALLIPAGDPTAPPQRVLPRRDGLEYVADDWGDRLVVLTNDDAVDFELRTLGVDPASGRTNGESATLLPHEPGRRLVDIDPFADFLVVSGWHDAQPMVWVLDRAGGLRTVGQTGEPRDIDAIGLPDWSTPNLRWSTQSLNSPRTLWEESALHTDDAERPEPRLVRRIPTPNVDLDAYRSSRRWATATDGTAVPVDIVHHVDTQLDGTAPLCVYAYGAYEASLPPWFSVARLSLLDRGWVWALAHPRGGGELGRGWYLDGKLLAKRNTFTDVIAVTEHLVADGVGAADKVALRGGSAGGLMAGACVTIRPDLFAAVVAEVPFVDVVSSMSDTTLPLTVTEWEEWGDPREEPFASYIESYSPYDATAPADYPPIYATAGMNDPRVSVHEPAKWIARLRDVSTSDAPMLLRTEMEAGHGGPSGRYDAWRDEARTITFLLATVAGTAVS